MQKLSSVHLNFRDIIYDNCSNATFSQMIESVHFNATLTTPDVILGSSPENHIKNYVLKVFMIDGGVGNFAFIVKSGTIIVHSI